MMWLLNQPLVPLVDSQVPHLLLEVVWAFRSTEVVSWMTAECRRQTTTPEATSETCVINFHSFSEESYPFLLSPFWLFGLLFLHLYTCFHTVISCWSCTLRKLPPLTSDLYPYKLLSVLKSSFTLCSQYQFFTHLFSFPPSSYTN